MRAATAADDYLTPGVSHGGLLTRSGRFYSVDYPGAKGTELYGISDYRQIGGVIHGADGHAHGLLCQK